MSEEDNISYEDPRELKLLADQEERDEYERFQEFKRTEARKAGIDVSISDLGDSVYVGTKHTRE